MNLKKFLLYLFIFIIITCGGLTLACSLLTAADTIMNIVGIALFLIFLYVDYLIINQMFKTLFKNEK